MRLKGFFDWGGDWGDWERGDWLLVLGRFWGAGGFRGEVAQWGVVWVGQRWFLGLGGVVGVRGVLGVNMGILRMLLLLLLLVVGFGAGGDIVNVLLFF